MVKRSSVTWKMSEMHTNRRPSKDESDDDYVSITNKIFDSLCKKFLRKCENFTYDDFVSSNAVKKKRFKVVESSGRVYVAFLARSAENSRDNPNSEPSDERAKPAKTNIFSNLFSKLKHVEEKATHSKTVAYLYENKNKDRCSSSKLSSDTNVSLEETPKMNFGENSQTTKKYFFRKNLKKRQIVGNEDFSPSFSRQDVTVKDDTKNELSEMDNTNNDAPIFMSSNFSLEPTLSNGLQEVVAFSSRLQTSENHLMLVLAKYLRNNDLKKDLVDGFYGHARLQIEAERRAQNLANEMWLQQSEMHKDQQKSLRDNLSEIVKQNRKLQGENDTLMRKYEKLCAKFAADDQSNGLHGKVDSQIIDHLHKNNEKLHSKLNGVQQLVAEIEERLSKEQKKNESLESQIRASYIQIQHHKVAFQNMKIDFELELADLGHQFETTDSMLRESIDAGDVLVDDMQNIKAQLAAISVTIDWSKTKVNGNTLTDVIRICRSCLQSLSRHIITTHSEATTFQKEREAHNEERTKLTQMLQELEKKYLTLVEDGNKIREVLKERDMYVADVKALEQKLCKFQDVINEKNANFTSNRKSLTTALESLEHVKEQLAQKTTQVNNLNSESDALKHQVNSLNQILQSSGAGDVARELANTQEKLSMLQSLYHQVLAEKNGAFEKLNASLIELQVCKEVEKECVEKYKSQRVNLEVANVENAELKNQIVTQQATVTALQNERVRHLAEKNFLRNVYAKLKEELGRVEGLEGTLTTTNNEANRLALIAEFNKQLGEKLQREVAERDAVIMELRDNVRKFNDIQRTNIKEKVALCEELAELCGIKDVLSGKLNAEIQKGNVLNQSKIDIQSSAEKQFESIKEMQKTERAAIKELLTDFNSIVTQKQDLVASHKSLNSEVETLRSEVAQQKEKLARAETITNDKKSKIKDLERQLVENREALRTSKTQMQESNENHRMTIEKLQSENHKIIVENEKLKSGVEYLQKNVQKLHDDLNDARTSENETKTILQNELAKIESLEKKIADQSYILVAANKEIERLELEIDEMKHQNSAVQADYRNLVREATESARVAQENLEKTTRSEREIQRLSKVVEEKTSEVAVLEEQCANEKRVNKSLSASLEFAKMEEKRLKEDLLEFEAKCESFDVKMGEFGEEKRRLKAQVEELQDKLEGQENEHQCISQQCDIRIENAQKTHKEQLTTYEATILKLNEDKVKEITAYAKLEDSHRDLAAKLLKSVHLLIDEKLARQATETKSNQLSQQLAQLEAEKGHVAEKLDAAKDVELKCEKKIVALSNEKVAFEDEIERLRDDCQRHKNQYESLERKFVELEQASEEKAKYVLLAGENNQQVKGKLMKAEDRLEELKVELENNHKYVLSLQNDVAKLEQDKTVMEFQRCELELQLHDTRAKLATETALCVETTTTNERLLSNIFEMRDAGALNRTVCDKLLAAVCNQTM